MALKVYIGARYTPKFEGEWKANKEYAALSVVYYNNKSYVSRKTVTAGTAVTETEFWIESADWNAQVEQYNQNVTQYKGQVDLYNKNVETYTKQVNKFYADTLHSYETRDEMIADTNIKLGDTLLTCGKDTIGDGGGSFYQVVNTQSQKTVVLANGLYAAPFEFQPYDYAAFEQKTNEYKAEVDQQLNKVEKYSLRNYDTTNKMVADKSLMTGNTVLTSGENSVGDGQGSFWKVVDQNSSDATALANGKYAKPFQLNPYEVSNRVTDNLNPDFKTGIPPCVWSGTVHGNGINITLGTLPSHKQDDGSYKVDCTIFLNASFETTTERTSVFSIIHGGYAGLPALTYKFTVSGKNESATTTKTQLIAVRLMATYTNEQYSAAKGSNTIVTSWNSAETDIDYNAPEAITQVQTTADSSGIAYAWTGLPRTNSFFMPITAKKDGYTLSTLHFTAGANVASVDDALWTITFSKYDDAATLHTANFYAVNGSEVDYNVNVGFALAKGTTYKMTFSGPEGAKLNFPTVAASAIQENEDVDVKTAPGYWNDNNTVVFSGTVELSKQATPGPTPGQEKVVYTSSKQVTEYTGAAGTSTPTFTTTKPILLTGGSAIVTPSSSSSSPLNAGLLQKKADNNNYGNLVYFDAKVYTKVNILKASAPVVIRPNTEYYYTPFNLFTVTDKWSQPENYGTLVNSTIVPDTTAPLIGQVSFIEGNSILYGGEYATGDSGSEGTGFSGTPTLTITAKKTVNIIALQFTLMSDAYTCAISSPNYNKTFTSTEVTDSKKIYVIRNIALSTGETLTVKFTKSGSGYWSSYASNSLGVWTTTSDDNFNASTNTRITFELLY